MIIFDRFYDSLSRNLHYTSGVLVLALLLVLLSVVIVVAMAHLLWCCTIPYTLYQVLSMKKKTGSTKLCLNYLTN